MNNKKIKIEEPEINEENKIDEIPKNKIINLNEDFLKTLDVDNKNFVIDLTNKFESLTNEFTDENGNQFSDDKFTIDQLISSDTFDSFGKLFEDKFNMKNFKNVYSDFMWDMIQSQKNNNMSEGNFKENLFGSLFKSMDKYNPDFISEDLKKEFQNLIISKKELPDIPVD